MRNGRGLQSWPMSTRFRCTTSVPREAGGPNRGLYLKKPSTSSLMLGAGGNSNKKSTINNNIRTGGSNSPRRFFLVGAGYPVCQDGELDTSSLSV